MRNIVVTIMLCLIYETDYSQDLAIELSIEWNSELMELNFNSFDGLDPISSIPYLVITYKNQTTDPIYCRTVIKLTDKYLTLPGGSVYHSRNDLGEMVKKSSNI